MPGDHFYTSPLWRRLRRAALERDNFTCVVPGCGHRATHVDHIKRRRDGGVDALHNLRSLCHAHDNQIKERPNGTRANKGRLTVRGVGVDGRPLDPKHAWNL